MKTIGKFLCCLIFFFFVGFVSAEEGKQIIPTQNKFAKKLTYLLQSKLTFVLKKDLIQIKAKPEATLPLEFVAGKGLEPSDGTLSVNDSFAWPGCGFDRTSYTLKKITPKSVVITYIRGIPQQDGYQDSGEFSIAFKDVNREQGGSEKAATHSESE